MRKFSLSVFLFEAYEFVVNGKPALDWVVDCQYVRTDRACSIVNDANDWATETMNDPRYSLELFQQVPTVRIVKSIPKFDI